MPEVSSVWEGKQKQKTKGLRVVILEGDTASPPAKTSAAGIYLLHHENFRYQQETTQQQVTFF